LDTCGLHLFNGGLEICSIYRESEMRVFPQGAVSCFRIQVDADPVFASLKICPFVPSGDRPQSHDLGIKPERSLQIPDSKGYVIDSCDHLAIIPRPVPADPSVCTPALPHPRVAPIIK
jgi:hypothetical protein